MPLPKPRKNEEEDKFIERCMSDEQMEKEFSEQDQRLAVCYSQWKKGKETKMIERRYIKATELRVDEDGNTITGYGAVFGVWSSTLGFFKEKIRKGAFARSIKNNDVRSLFNHDANFILGRTKNKTLRLWEDEKGLGFEAQLPDTSYARDLVTNIKRKNVTQNSFGFETVEDRWSKKGDKRELLEVKLFDVGPVTFPAYPQTTVQARAIFNDIGVDYDSLCRVFIKKNKDVELTNSDKDLIESTIAIFRNYLPEEQPEVHSEVSADSATAEVESTETEEPDVAAINTDPDYSTLFKTAGEIIKYNFSNYLKS